MKTINLHAKTRKKETFAIRTKTNVARKMLRRIARRLVGFAKCQGVVHN